MNKRGALVRKWKGRGPSGSPQGLQFATPHETAPPRDPLRFPVPRKNFPPLVIHPNTLFWLAL